MNNQVSTQWGVTPGRQVGAVTKRFHKRRDGTDAERAVAHAHGVSLGEARRILRYAQSCNALKDTATKANDYLALEVARQVRLSDAQVKSEKVERERAARVAAYLSNK